MTVPHLRLAPTPAGLAAPKTPEGAIRVVLADDHALMRSSLRLLLENEEDVEVIAEAGDLASVIRRVDGGQPNVLVLDLELPDGSSSEAIRQLRERAPEMQIVIITMHENPMFAQRALAAGAIGFVLKDLADEELPTAIRCAAQGKRYLSPRLLHPLQGMHRAVSEDKLTVREVEVLRLVALGFTSVEIARRLGLSPRTVETRRARIGRKLGLDTRAGVVAYALRRGLLGP
ncbi:MAG: two-component system, NarL family, response regulator NreC [Solirubrobacteraceae bacterium]|jgi:two-component system response regulator NreC|nr:two-component system, NarL family, response regulator NreC [Solirubrobacteraceae bacterium]